MKLQVHEDTLRRYLLGDLAAEEMDELEEMYLQDGDLFERLSFVEDELIDAHVRDELSPADSKKFDTNYLTSPRRKEKVENAKAVRAYISRIAVVKTEGLVEEQESPSLWQKLRAFILPGNFVLGAAVATSVILAIGGAWMVYRLAQMQSQLNSMSHERASLEEKTRQLEQELNQKGGTPEQTIAQQPPGTQGQLKDIARLFLKGPDPDQMTRGSGPVKREVIRIEPDIKTIQLELFLVKQQHRTYQAVLKDSRGAQIDEPFTFPSITNGKVTFKVPASKFINGDYTILLNGRNDGGAYEPVREYPVRIVTNK